MLNVSSVVPMYNYRIRTHSYISLHTFYRSWYFKKYEIFDNSINSKFLISYSRVYLEDIVIFIAFIYQKVLLEGK